MDAKTSPIAAAALCALAIFTTGQIAWAAEPTQAAAAQPGPAVSPAIEQRINALQSQLGITSAQMPLWTTFAQAMRENAASTDKLFQQRAGATASMSAAENMRSYAQLARAYADDTDKLATAFESLYGSLSESQKKAADALFKQQSSAAAQPHK